MANLVNQLKQLFAAHPEAFPDRGALDYGVEFDQLAGFLDRNVHDQVATAALARDAAEVAQQLSAIQNAIQANVHPLPVFDVPQVAYLTDHGVRHIQTVIRRASSLISIMDCKLTPYEIYILLAAIHLHDVGNLYGRDNHEARIADVITNLHVPFTIGVSEQKIIRRIAAAHGGKVAGDKDTIGKLPQHEYVDGCKVRMQYLAAILRFADELADDRTRASRVATVIAPAVVAGSAVYHAYSKQLESVTIEEERVELRFQLSQAEVLNEFDKGNSQVYLIDEIFNRTLKMHYECMYCMRFIRSQPEPKYEGIDGNQWFSRPKTIDTIKVSIEIYTDFRGEDLPIAVIEYPLKENGYPSYASQDIHVICPEINRSFSSNFGVPVQASGLSLKGLMHLALRRMNNE